MTKRQDRDAIYVKRQFDTEIIILCVRWYITYRLVVRNNWIRGCGLTSPRSFVA